MKKAYSCALLGTFLTDPTAAAPKTEEFCFAVSPRGGESEWGRYDAVFVFSESTKIDPSVIAGFIGHPHLRAVIGKTAEEQEAAFTRELNALTADVESEYKFLITFPDTDPLKKSPFAAYAGSSKPISSPPITAPSACGCGNGTARSSTPTP